jgi:hypothetical protein
MRVILGKTITLLFLVVLVFYGCGTLNVRKVESGEPVILEKQKTLVFGRIFLIQNNKVKVPYGLKRLSLHILNIESEKTKKWLYVEKNGSFYWTLPRGSYAITDVAIGCDYSIQPQVKFDVPLEGDVFYLGTLKLDVERKIFRRDIIKSIEIIDEFDAAMKIIVNRNPDFIFAIEKSLFIIIPDKSPTIGNAPFPCGVPPPFIKFH